MLIEQDFAVIHLGSGSHRFVKGINNVYHDFEPIQKTIEWQYRQSILNLFNSSESNILSVANNQRILHHFLFEQDKELDDVDIVKRPKTYFPHRTQKSFEYFCGGEKIFTENLQIEIDLTIEFNGTVGVFEAKNGTPGSFNVFQIYHPFLYYHEANQQVSSIQGKIEYVYAVYLVRENIAEEKVSLKLWKYTFQDPYDMASIKCLESSNYILTKQEAQQ
jgi:hypothetical protein